MITGIMLKICSKANRNTKCGKCSRKLRACLFWNFVLRLLVETFLELGLCSILNLKTLSFSSIIELLSIIASTVLIICFLYLPFIILRIVWAHPSELYKPEIQSKVGMLYESTTRKTSYSGGLFYVFFILHRLVFVFNVFTLPPLP